MCGEKHDRYDTHAPWQGSPPHVRGKEARRPHRHELYGITPACAGKRKQLILMLYDYLDHPRMCGEKSQKYRYKCVWLGSPPHVRGKGEVHILIRVAGRITPACAGKRSAYNGLSVNVRDHPRMCGEKLPGAALVSSTSGSPPHVRGKELEVTPDKS